MKLLLNSRSFISGIKVYAAVLFESSRPSVHENFKYEPGTPCLGCHLCFPDVSRYLTAEPEKLRRSELYGRNQVLKVSGNLHDFIGVGLPKGDKVCHFQCTL